MYTQATQNWHFTQDKVENCLNLTNYLGIFHLTKTIRLCFG